MYKYSVKFFIYLFIPGQWYNCSDQAPTPKHFQLGPFCFVCLRCDRRYKYVRNLKKHQRYQCGVPPQFQCKICSNFFTQKSSLRGHMRTVHHIVC